MATNARHSVDSLTIQAPRDLPQLDNERIDVKDFIAMIDYVLVGIGERDPPAAYCLGMARQSLFEYGAQQSQSLKAIDSDRR